MVVVAILMVFMLYYSEGHFNSFVVSITMRNKNSLNKKVEEKVSFQQNSGNTFLNFHKNF